MKLNLNEKLDFNDIDLTAPNIVVEEILAELPTETNGIIAGQIKTYSGPVFSYKKPGLSGLSVALGTADKQVDIQSDLGEIGEETHKFECFLYTPEYEKYRYRMFFLKYHVSNYPATVILENSVARSVFGTDGGYIHKCNTRQELETLIVNVLTSKRVLAVMQELIRVNQAKKTTAQSDAPASENEE